MYYVQFLSLFLMVVQVSCAVGHSFLYNTADSHAYELYLEGFYVNPKTGKLERVGKQVKKEIQFPGDPIKNLIQKPAEVHLDTTKINPLVKEVTLFEQVVRTGAHPHVKPVQTNTPLERLQDKKEVTSNAVKAKLLSERLARMENAFIS